MPKVNRYFYVAEEDFSLRDGLTLSPSQFVKDSGKSCTRFADYGRQGYYNLYVNGVLQQGGLYKVTSKKLSLAADQQSILKGTPIILEVVGFGTQRLQR